MKLLKNKSIFLLGALLVFVIFTIIYMLCTLTKNKFDDKQININEKGGQATASIDQSWATEIIASLLSSGENEILPEIKIIKATNSHIKANLFYNPGGSYLLAAKIGNEWKKVLEGNGIPKCSEISKYGFPSNIVPSCINEDSENIIKNEWPLIKGAIASCNVKGVMQAHSLYVSANLKNGDRLEGFEPKIDDIISLAIEAQRECGEIIMATE